MTERKMTERIVIQLPPFFTADELERETCEALAHRGADGFAVVYDMSFVKAINRHLFQHLLKQIRQLNQLGWSVYLKKVPPAVALVMADYMLGNECRVSLQILDDSTQPPRVVTVGASHP